MAIRRSLWPSFRGSASTQRAVEDVAAAVIAGGDRTISYVAGRIRGRHLLAIDLLGMFVASDAALSLRFGFTLGTSLVSAFLPLVLCLLLVQTLTNVRLGLYSRRWRFASVADLERIVLAVTLGTFAAAIVAYGAAVPFGLGWTSGLPESFWLAEVVLEIAVIGSVRFGIRAASEWAVHSDRTSANRRPALLYGAGRTGVIIAGSARRDPGAGVLPVGFLDDDACLKGGQVAGLRVFGGLTSLEQAVIETGAEVLLITMPSAPGSAVRRVVEAALALHIEVRTVPSLNDLLDGSLDCHRIRQVHVDDLIRRPIVTDHAAAVREIIGDRTVIITGAGGSIGSELARQVFGIGPRRLVLVDRAESPLYTVQRELEQRREHGKGNAELRPCLANVASRAAMERLVEAERPSVIFHAAAYKHVPMMEDHPSDAAYVNMGGTMALLDAAAAGNVERFVFVSTDKAVRPSSVMGASKRIAEMLVAETAARTGRPYVSVRFGNVLGSTGSVVPIFQGQLEKGEALTITHPDMTRFFMTIPEAAWLILEAAALGTRGDLFVLDMGEPIRIMDLAQDLVRLSGRDPESQPIEIVGLRPGEKLHEELFYAAEGVERTSSAKVLRVVAGPPPDDVRPNVRRLLSLATGEDEPRLREAILAYARALEGPVAIEPAVAGLPIDDCGGVGAASAFGLGMVASSL